MNGYKSYRVERPYFCPEVGQYLTIGNVVLVKTIDLRHYLEPLRLGDRQTIPPMMSEVRSADIEVSDVKYREPELSTT